jgi:hypothetical protein
MKTQHQLRLFHQSHGSSGMIDGCLFSYKIYFTTRPLRRVLTLACWWVPLINASMSIEAVDRV